MILDGKTVVVTGVGAGLGSECARSALAQGANVVVAARSADRLAAEAQALDASGERVLAVRTDITDAASCEELVQRATDRFGRIDGLVQVAAYENVWGGLHHTNLDDWRAAFDTNVLGALTVLRPVTKVMTAAGGGSIVLIGSQSMFKPSLPQAGYAASKHALLTAMYYLVDELGPDNIRLNMVVPSWMWGPPVEGFVKMTAERKGISEDAALQGITRKFPLRRMAEDGEVADVVAFFLSDLAKAVTGQHLLVNAGELSR
ncbi:MAG: SDR family oxidoreductase [Jatrophihabitans sp.]|uniref:SDR family oxidoreductase n=1 Tax=Jatrophihabitans sp. TaxID=1932789 RepID=UPI003F818F9F